VSEHDTTQVLLLLFFNILFNERVLTRRAMHHRSFIRHDLSHSTASQRLPARRSRTTGHVRRITWPVPLLDVTWRLTLGRSGLVVACMIAVWEDPDSNLTADSCLYHDSHCDMKPWSRAAHPCCSA